ncbi:MAG: adenylyl-sulfate kinase [archaeon]
MVYNILIYGKPNAGKSTISYNLVQDKLRNCVVFDGDVFREYITPELGFSREDILKNNYKCMKTIQMMNAQGFNTITAMIMPYEESREYFRINLENLVEVYLCPPDEAREKRPNHRATEIIFEVPPAPSDVIIHLDTEEWTIEECKRIIYEEMKGRKLIE